MRDPNGAAVRLVVLKSAYPGADLSRILQEKPGAGATVPPNTHATAQQARGPALERPRRRACVVVRQPRTRRWQRKLDTKTPKPTNPANPQTSNALKPPGLLLQDIEVLRSNARQVHDLLADARDRDALLTALPMLLEPRTLISVLVTVVGQSAAFNRGVCAVGRGWAASCPKRPSMPRPARQRRSCNPTMCAVPQAKTQPRK